jgi:hypothetical protein
MTGYRPRLHTPDEERRWQAAHDDGITGAAFAERFGITWYSAQRAAEKLGLVLTTRPRVPRSRVCACGAGVAHGASQCLACFRQSRPELFDRRLPVRRSAGGDG